MARKKNGGSQYQGASGSANQQVLPISLHSEEHLTISTLETWLWDAACAIRGNTDAPKYKDFILPLIFYKRLSDVFDDECSKFYEEFGDFDYVILRKNMLFMTEEHSNIEKRLGGI